MAVPCCPEVVAAPAAASPAGGHRFSAAAGPLPPDVVDEVADACRSWRGGGSVLSLPFTSEAFRELQHETQARLRRLLGLPPGYQVLFMQGGASAQFALVPLNLLGPDGAAAHVDTGHWSRRAAAEAARHARVVTLRHDALDEPAPPREASPVAYLHLTSNETADGWQWPRLPSSPWPLVVDMSSDLLTRAIDCTGLGLLYASAQKALGVPGLTLVIVRDDLLGRARPSLPGVMNYTALAAADSRLNTPPVFAIFVAHAMLGWIERQGGVPAMARTATRRSHAVYQALDASDGFYRPRVGPAWRSRIHPCFGLADPALTPRFLEQARAAGLFDLQGHPDVGGLRVSLYNGTPEAAVSALLSFLQEFQRTHG